MTAAGITAEPKPPEWNRTGLNFRQPMPRPKVRGWVIDAHTHLLASGHAPVWFEARRHYGFDAFITMTPLEEALKLQRQCMDRLHFIAIPKWSNSDFDDWMRRIDGFYNLGSRII